MFLCREHELQILTQHYQKDALECIVIYGRRRVGKTALINEFVKDKKAIFFPALKANAQDNLEALSKAITQYQHPGFLSAPVYRSSDEAKEARISMALRSGQFHSVQISASAGS